MDHVFMVHPFQMDDCSQTSTLLTYLSPLEKRDAEKIVAVILERERVKLLLLVFFIVHSGIQLESLFAHVFLY
jgi:hypothetical protein